MAATRRLDENDCKNNADSKTRAKIPRTANKAITEVCVGIHSKENSSP